MPTVAIVLHNHISLSLGDHVHFRFL